MKLLHHPANEVEGRFFCRLASQSGQVVPGQLCSTRTYPLPAQAKIESYRWIRFAAPPLVSAIHLPPLQYPHLVFVDGKSTPSARVVHLPSGTRQVTLRIDDREILDAPAAFSTTPGELALGTWMRPGLRNFSGEMSYEKELELSHDSLQEGLLLDCGEVGVVAEAWLNDQYLGSRAWAPFAFNLTQHARPGRNQLKVHIANTEGNARAVGPSRRHLDAIDVSGWHGPARLIPFFDRDLHLE